MTTEAQTEANRANAQKSTGPRTPEGKAKVAQNALKHGLLAKQAVVVGEDTDDFDLLRDQFRAELAPVGLTESRLVERIAGLSWRLQRAERFHTESFDVMCQQCADDPQIKRWRPRLVPDAADPVVGLTVVKDFSETKVLDRLLMYERRIENSLYRTMAELHKVQGQRQGAVGGPATSPRGAVRDTHPMDLSMEQDRGGPFHRVPETLPPDFTLDNLLAKIAALEEGPQTPKDAFGNPQPPAGVTTNTPPDLGQSCETKPICAGPEEEVGRGRPTLDQVEGRLHEEGPQTRRNAFGNPETPAGVTTNTPQAQSQLCETKPICGSPRGTGIPSAAPLRAGPARESQSWAGRPCYCGPDPGAIVRNKPNLCWSRRRTKSLRHRG